MLFLCIFIYISCVCRVSSPSRATRVHRVNNIESIAYHTINYSCSYIDIPKTKIQKKRRECGCRTCPCICMYPIVCLCGVGLPDFSPLYVGVYYFMGVARVKSNPVSSALKSRFPNRSNIISPLFLTPLLLFLWCVLILGVGVGGTSLCSQTLISAKTFCCVKKLRLYVPTFR